MKTTEADVSFGGVVAALQIRVDYKHLPAPLKRNILMEMLREIYQTELESKRLGVLVAEDREAFVAKQKALDKAITTVMETANEIWSK